MRRFACLLPMLMTLWALPAEALPLEFTQEGLVLDGDGRPVEGEHRVWIRLYAGPAGGQPLFSEAHQRVDFFQGYYAVPVGGIEALDPALFARETLYMGVTLDDGDELTPRTALRLVPGAFYAHTADNVVGDITPSSVSIPGVGLVIDADGRWVGDPAGLRGPAGPAGPDGPVGPAGPAGGNGSPDTPQQVRDKLRQVDGVGSLVDADLLDGRQGGEYVRTAEQIIERLRTVDGPGSGLDADRIDGLDGADLVLTAEQLLGKLRAVDGAGSGLDADRLDGLDSTQLLLTPDEIRDRLVTVDGAGSGVDADRLDGLDSTQLFATAEDILERLRTVDGAGSGVDADRIDGLDSTAFVQADDPDLPDRVVGWVQEADGAGSGLDADRLDGLDSSRFMRVDRDTGTSGALTVGGRINAASGIAVRAGERVGIGVAAPEAELHVDGTIIADTVRTRVLRADVLQLDPLDRPPAPAAAGMLYFDANSRGLHYHDGEQWNQLASIGPPTSCRAILEAGRDEGTGEYLVDLDGPAGPIPPTRIFCDMETDGGGWTRITPCLAQRVLGGRLAPVDAAAVEGIDDDCRPFTRDENGSHTYHYTFDVPGGFSQFYLDDYVIRANARNGNTSDLAGATFVQQSWAVGYGGSKGDIGFGTSGQNGPITSYARVLAGSNNCRDCERPFPQNGRIFDLGARFASFRIGWGERGGQHEGWYPWWSGSIMVR